MPSKANNNGAPPLVQPPVRTLAVPEYLRPRIEAAHKRIEEEHPGAMSHQASLLQRMAMSPVSAEQAAAARSAWGISG